LLDWSRASYRYDRFLKLLPFAACPKGRGLEVRAPELLTRSLKLCGRSPEGFGLDLPKDLDDLNFVLRESGFESEGEGAAPR
jgi:hypothetical protein